jgi:hypothetical protein
MTMPMEMPESRKSFISLHSARTMSMEIVSSPRLKISPLNFTIARLYFTSYPQQVFVFSNGVVNQLVTLLVSVHKTRAINGENARKAKSTMRSHSIIYGG